MSELSLSIVGAIGSEPTERVLKTLREQGTLSSAEVARLSGLAKSTVSAIVSRLKEAGVVVDASKAPSPYRSTGRPATLLTLNPRVGGVIGILLGPDHVHAVLADVSHAVLETRSVHVGLGYDVEDGLSAVEGVVGEIRNAVGFAEHQIFGVGIAIPGPVHPHTGRVGRSSMIPRWRGVRAREAFQARLPMRVFVDNESNCAVLGELMWGAAMNLANVLYIKLDLGVGGAVVVDGKIVRGVAGGGGEFGHMTYRDDGPLCGCGNRGCYHMYCATPMLLEQLRPQYGPNFTVDEMIAAARSGDIACARVVADAGAIAGEAIAAACNLLDPERVIVGGQLSFAGEVLFEPLRRSFARHALLLHEGSDPDTTTTIVAGTRFGNDPALGAVGLVLHRIGEMREREPKAATGNQLLSRRGDPDDSRSPAPAPVR